MAQNATYIKLKIGTKVLIGETSNSLEKSVDEIDTSNKAGGRVTTLLPGRVKDTVSFESLCDDTNATDYSYAEAAAAADAGTLVSCEVGRYDAAGAQVDASQKITFSGYIVSLTKDNPDNDRSTMSGSISISGAVTYDTYTAP